MSPHVDGRYVAALEEMRVQVRLSNAQDWHRSTSVTLATSSPLHEARREMGGQEGFNWGLDAAARLVSLLSVTWFVAIVDPLELLPQAAQWAIDSIGGQPIGES